MPTPARAVIDRMFAAFNARDLDAALATVSADTVWIHHGTQKMPSVRFEGTHGARQFFRTSFESMQIDYFRPLQFIEQDNSIVVLGEERYTMLGIDGTLANRWVQVYTVQHGLITRMEEFATSAAPESYLQVR